jgi:PhnB protein
VEQRAVPFISYENVEAAVNWLTEAFGFEERGERYTDADGRVTHAELALDRAVVMLGWPGPEYRSPKRHAEECEQAGRWLEPPNVVDGVLVYVDDLDAHFERAQAAGATILREPMEEPYGRLYNAADLEGHRWMFMEAPG